MDDFVKVRFSLPTDEDGWPPFGSEGMWCNPVPGGQGGEQHFVVDNTPFFVRGLAAGDTVAAVADEDGTWWGRSVVARSGRMTVRVLVLPSGPFRGDQVAASEHFKAAGVLFEGMGDPVPILALDLGPETDLAATKALLRKGMADRWWEWEEGFVSQEWFDL